MAAAPRSPPVDHVALAEALAALASPVRLQLLDALRLPLALTEIRLSPYRRDELPADRVVARQTLQRHLDHLAEAEIVRVDRDHGRGRAAPTYVVDVSRLYALAEQLRSLAIRHAGASPGGADATTTGDAPPPTPQRSGPRLLLVHGVYEGKVFALDEAAQGRQWIIGRSRELPVPLDYDPYVSAEHAVITRQDDRYAVADLGSKNGTHLNWHALDAGAPQPLRSGDVIGLGRSLLVFVEH